MGRVIPVLLATQSYKLDALSISAQRCVNGYAQNQPPSAKSQVVVKGTPGIVTWATCGSGPVRGMHTLAGVPFVVSGHELYSVDQYGTATQVGAGIVGDGPVSMADNGTEIGIVASNYGWTYDSTNALRLITDPQFYAANTIDFYKGLFVFDRKGTNQIFHSGVLDGQSYPATNAADAETSSDLVLAVTEYKGNLMVWGEKTIEPWYFTGATIFPMQAYDGSTIQRGLTAALSIVKEAESLFFVGDDLIHYKLAGAQLVPESTPAISQAWQKHSANSDAYSFSYTFDGHKFIVVQFPTANETWVKDITTGLYHERDSMDPGGTLVRWRGNCSTEAYGKVLVGDRFTGKVGYLSNSVFTEFGDNVKMKLVAPVMHAGGQRIFCSYFEVDMETGVGTASGDGSDPTVSLWLSEDAGHTYYPLAQAQSMGTTGQYRQLVRWNQLGSFYDGVVKLEITDPVRRAVIAARACVSVGS